MSTKIEQEQIWNYVETWIQVEKPISNTENRHPMQSLAPLQKEGNISYHSICPRKSSARKKERKKMSGDMVIFADCGLT